MRKYRTFFYILLITLMCVALSYNILFSDDTQKSYRVSVLLGGSSDERWTVVKTGMQKAAKDQNILLNFVTVGAYISINDEWDLIDQEIKSGADAIVFQPVGSDGMAQKMEGVTTPMVLVDGDVYPEGVYTSVHADEGEIGRQIARALYADYGENLKKQRIGIISSSYIHMTMSERADGFLKELLSYGIHPAWRLGLDSTLRTALDRQLSGPGADILVCLGNHETETAVDAVLDAGLDTVIYGQGYSEKNVYYLDKGVISCLVLSNEYYMGYRSIELAANKVKHEGEDSKGEDVLELHCVHTGDLYAEDNQKIMFPLVQ